MSEFGNQIEQRGLSVMRTQTQVQVVRAVHYQSANGAVIDAPVLPTSAYMQMTPAGYMVLTSKMRSDVDFAQHELQASAASASTLVADGHIASAVAGIMVQFAIPEVVLTQLFELSAAAQNVEAYVPFRNAVYLRTAAQLQANMGGLLTALGCINVEKRHVDWHDLASYQRTALQAVPGSTIGRITFGYNALDEEGVLSLNIDLPLITLVNQSALEFVRDNVWAALAGVNAEGMDVLPALTRYYEAAAAAAPDALTTLAAVRSGLNTQQDQAVLLPGFGHFDATNQLVLRTALAQGADLEPMTADVLRVDYADQMHFVGPTGLSFNSPVALKLTADRLGIKRALGLAGLPTPNGASYTTREACLADFDRSFHDKTIVVKAQNANRAQTTLFRTPPTRADFEHAIDAVLVGGPVVVEMMAHTDTFRLLVLDGNVLSTISADYAHVVADGRTPVQALISRRNSGRMALPYPPVVVDAAVEVELARQNVTLATVPERFSEIYLGRNSRTALSGDFMWADADLDQSYQQLALKAVQALGLRYATVDLVVRNGFVPYAPANTDARTGVSVVGVNGTPNLIPFVLPTANPMGAADPAVLTRVLAAWTGTAK